MTESLLEPCETCGQPLYWVDDRSADGYPGCWTHMECPVHEHDAWPRPNNQGWFELVCQRCGTRRKDFVELDRERGRYGVTARTYDMALDARTHCTDFGHAWEEA